MSGGTSPARMLRNDLENDGLRFYKRGFGSVERVVHAYHYSRVGAVNVLKDRLVRGQSSLSRLARAVLRQVPAPGLRVLGRAIFRHMG